MSLPGMVLVGIKYKDGHIQEVYPYDITWDGETSHFKGYFVPDPGTVVEAGMRLFGVWEWSPMFNQTFSGDKKWSWRKFRFIEINNYRHSLTINYDWKYVPTNKKSYREVREEI
jgi:hypothetical protein